MEHDLGNLYKEERKTSQGSLTAVSKLCIKIFGKRSLRSKSNRNAVLQSLYFAKQNDGE